MTCQLLRAVAPPLGTLVEEQSRTEGQYRAVQSRVIQYSEEIAFYKGAAVEKRRILESFQAMLKQIMKVASVRAPYQVLEGFLMKYAPHALFRCIFVASFKPSPAAFL